MGQAPIDDVAGHRGTGAFGPILRMVGAASDRFFRRIAGFWGNTGATGPGQVHGRQEATLNNGAKPHITYVDSAMARIYINGWMSIGLRLGQ